jgi:hypothetical protein
MQIAAIDLPLVTPIAQKIVEEEGATDRVKVIATDVLDGPLPLTPKLTVRETWVAQLATPANT